MEKTQVAVIGGGPGGYAAAFRAADLGLSVTLIDSEVNPGGVCLYRGCIPSKALLHAAKLINETKDAANWGLYFGEPRIKIAELRDWKNKVVKQLTGGLGMLVKQRKITYVQGFATFKDSNTVIVKTANDEEKEISFEHAILATGSSPTKVPSLWIDSTRLMDSTGALELRDIPQSLLVIGGGYIGLEMGSVYAALGTRVTVVEMTDGLLPGADRDLVAVLQKRIEKQFHSVLLKTKVLSLTEQRDSVKVLLENENGEKNEELFSRVVMCVGRKPNSANLGLENTGVKINAKGFVEVDIQRRTAESSIFAIGDVAGEPMLAHKANHEGIVAAEVIAGHKVAYEPACIPAVVFTDPEIAWAGITEKEAKAQNLDVQIAKFPWAASGRAVTLDRTDGLTKLIVDKSTERILGVGIVGAGAGEMIAEAAMAIEMAALAIDMQLTIHPHPTLSETLMETAEQIYGSSTHLYRPKR
ncbi:MAG: dihydrolipoyl dehydrogenase [Abditibacteriaceae bacterium]